MLLRQMDRVCLKGLGRRKASAHRVIVGLRTKVVAGPPPNTGSNLVPCVFGSSNEALLGFSHTLVFGQS